MKKLLAILLLSSAAISSTHAFTLPSGFLQPLSLTTGAGAGYAAQDFMRENGSNSLGRTLVGGLCGGALYYLSYKFFYGITAKGKFDRANNIAERVTKNTLISGIYPSEDAVRAQARKTYFGSNWPLVEAHEDLVQTLKDLSHAQGLATDARNNAGKNDALVRNSDKLLAVLVASSNKVSSRIGEMIGDGEEYDRQYRRFQEWQKIKLQEESNSLQDYAIMNDTFNNWQRLRNDKHQHSEFVEMINNILKK